jgi:hypothetical protein
VSYESEISAARKRYQENQRASAYDALCLRDKYEKPLQTVCKDIAGEGWDALRKTSERLEKTAGQTAAERGRAREKESRRIDEAKVRSVIKKDPGFVRDELEKAIPIVGRRHTDEISDAPGHELDKALSRIEAVLQFLNEGDREPNPLDVREIRAGLTKIENVISEIRAVVDGKVWDEAIAELEDSGLTQIENVISEIRAVVDGKVWDEAIAELEDLDA